MKKTIYTVMLVLVATACATSKEKTTEVTKTSKTELTSADYVAQMTTKYPGYTVNQFDEGKNMFEMHCGKCHDLPKPTDYSEEKWDKIIPGMTKAVNKKEVLINEQQQESVLRYVVSVTTVAKK
jgi:cytochrome c5